LGEEIRVRFMAGGPIDPAFFVEQLDDVALRGKLLSRMMREGARQSQTLDREFSDTIIKIREKWYKQRKRLLNLQLQKAQQQNDSALCDRLLQEKTQLLNEEKHLLK
jgi:DNA primase